MLKIPPLTPAFDRAQRHEGIPGQGRQQHGQRAAGGADFSECLQDLPGDAKCCLKPPPFIAGFSHAEPLIKKFPSTDMAFKGMPWCNICFQSQGLDE